MNLKDYYKNFFRKIYIIDTVAGEEEVKKVLNLLPSLPVNIITSKEEIPLQDQNQHTLLLNAPKGPILGRCPGSQGHLCCNYLTIDLYAGCTLGCSYCIMRHYLNFSPIIVNIPTTETINTLLELAEKHAPLPIRVGTGEVGDSLLFDPLFRLSERFIRAFADTPNIHFEMKTKTDFVDHLLGIENKGQGVIGFSVNPPGIISGEEGCAANLEQRLTAAKKAVAAGYRVAFHFDPVFHYTGWQRDYMALIRELGGLPEERIAWISLGTFRYLPGLKDKIQQRWYLYDEFVPCRDKKYRYLQPLRTHIYKTILSGLREVYPQAPVYMCMESPAVWQKVFHKKPGKIASLYTIFTRVAPDEPETTLKSRNQPD